MKETTAAVFGLAILCAFILCGALTAKGCEAKLREDCSKLLADPNVSEMVKVQMVSNGRCRF